MANPNFLILDEPTNDLDVFTITVLEDFLQAFQGCLLVVSHDRYFMDKMVDHVFAFKGGGEVKDYPGNYTQYREAEAIEIKAQKEEQKANEQTTKTATTSIPKEKKKLSYKEKLEFEQLEKDIDTLETEKAELTAKLSSSDSDTETLIKAGERLNILVEELDEKTMRWLELSEFA